MFSIWTESYGGHYGPTFSDFFEKQNQGIANGNIDHSAVPLRLETLGIVNGCTDVLTQVPFYPQMAYNTYGLRIINETEYQSAVGSFPACSKLVNNCRSLADESDPFGTGTNTSVNKACSNAYAYCFETMWSAYQNYPVSKSPQHL